MYEMGEELKSAESLLEDYEEMGSEDKAHRKAMEAVAKYIRFNVTTKSAVIKGEKVEYFNGAKAVDSLMNSKWTTEPKSQDSAEPYFMNRTYAVDYCDRLLRARFFVRAEKTEVKHKTDLPAGSTEKDGKVSGTVRKRGEKISDSPGHKKQDDEGGEKRKRKFRLDHHRQQIFVGSKDEIYCWLYDPPSYTSYLIGLGVVVGAIALTLQPLWPDSSREAVWYISVVVFVLMGSMVVLIVVRWVIYGIILVLTAAKLKFWLLPNLDNEKSGFVESFKPLYSVEWVKKKSQKNSQKSSDITGELKEPEESLDSTLQSQKEDEHSITDNGLEASS